MKSTLYDSESSAAPVAPFSPLGWSALRRFTLAATACALLWAVVWWAL